MSLEMAPTWLRPQWQDISEDIAAQRKVGSAALPRILGEPRHGRQVRGTDQATNLQQIMGFFKIDQGDAPHAVAAAQAKTTEILNSIQQTVKKAVAGGPDFECL